MKYIKNNMIERKCRKGRETMKTSDFLEMLNGKEFNDTAVAEWFRERIQYNDVYIDTDHIFAGIREYDGGLVIGYRCSQTTLVDLACLAEWNVFGIRDVTKADLYRIGKSWEETKNRASFEPMKKPALTYAL